MEGGEGGEKDRCLDSGQRKVRGFDFQSEKVIHTHYLIVFTESVGFKALIFKTTTCKQGISFTLCKCIYIMQNWNISNFVSLPHHKNLCS